MTSKYKNQSYQLRLPSELKEFWAEEAKSNDRSLNAEIIHRLEQARLLMESVNVAAGGTPFDTTKETLKASILLTQNLMSTMEAGLKIAIKKEDLEEK